MASSGYTSCRCRDCMEIAVSDDMANPDFCNGCEDAGCEGGDHECDAPHAYCDGSSEAEVIVDNVAYCGACGQEW